MTLTVSTGTAGRTRRRVAGYAPRRWQRLVRAARPHRPSPRARRVHTPPADPRPTLGVLVEHRGDRTAPLVFQTSPRGWRPITTPDQPGADAVTLAHAALIEQTYLHAVPTRGIPSALGTPRTQPLVEEA